jgi:hypothetical protein
VLEGQTTYKIGYLNKDMTFSGLFKGTAVTKEGTDRLTLKTAGSTSPITVNGGTLELSNSSSTAITTGLVTVADKGTVTGTAIATGIAAITADELVDVYTLSGIRLYSRKPYAELRALLPADTYVIVTANTSHVIKIK